MTDNHVLRQAPFFERLALHVWIVPFSLGLALASMVKIFKLSILFVSCGIGALHASFGSSRPGRVGRKVVSAGADAGKPVAGWKFNRSDVSGLELRVWGYLGLSTVPPCENLRW